MTLQELRRQLAESQRRVDIALELLGERNERIEQLEDDIQVGAALQHELALPRKAHSQLQSGSSEWSTLDMLPNQWRRLLGDAMQDMRSIFHSQLELCVEQLTRTQAELERLKSSSSSSSSEANGSLQQQQGSQQLGEHQLDGGGPLPKQPSRQSLLLTKQQQPTPDKPSQQQSSQRPQPG
jgi:hypothetical protein